MMKRDSGKMKKRAKANSSGNTNDYYIFKLIALY